MGIEKLLGLIGNNNIQIISKPCFLRVGWCTSDATLLLFQGVPNPLPDCLYPIVYFLESSRCMSLVIWEYVFIIYFIYNTQCVTQYKFLPGQLSANPGKLSCDSICLICMVCLIHRDSQSLTDLVVCWCTLFYPFPGQTHCQGVKTTLGCSFVGIHSIQVVRWLEEYVENPWSLPTVQGWPHTTQRYVKACVVAFCLVRTVR